MAKGYISLHRQLQDNWLWQEQREFSKAEAWIDMLMTVNHTETNLAIKMEVFKCGVGESLLSLDSWAKRWGWDKSKVRRFFKLLETQQMIVTKSERKTTRLTICNYASYQCKRHEDETQMKRKRNANETQTTPNNNDNKKNNEINISFDEFWDLYDKKKGNKDNCKKKWNKLKDSDRELIIKTLPNFKNSVSDKQYLPYPETYLNGKRWNDEIEPTPQSQVADDLKPFLDIVNNDPKYKYKTDSQKVFEAGVLKALSQNS